MDDVSKVPYCPKCGKRMHEISFMETIVPAEVILKAAVSGFRPSSLRHFLCPEHNLGCTVSIRTLAEEREEMKKRNQYVVN